MAVRTAATTMSAIIHPGRAALGPDEAEDRLRVDEPPKDWVCAAATEARARAASSMADWV
jgi:tetrahydromethanopterin S-methyltransferase subunit C